MRHQYADATHPFGLLRASRERPRRRAADKRDKLSPPHSITSVARASSVAGIIRPSALVVLISIYAISVIILSAPVKNRRRAVQRYRPLITAIPVQAAGFGGQ
jgi:hypothetical protein